MIIIATLGLAGSILIHLFLHRLVKRHGGGIVRIYRFVLLGLVGLAILAAIAEPGINPVFLLLCYLFGFGFLVIEILASPFWGKMGYGTLLILYGLLGGFLYTMTQMPYGDRPFALVSSNQPSPLDTTNSPREWISGLPLGPSAVPANDQESTAPAPPLAGPVRKVSVTERFISWSDVEPLMDHDSHIRKELVALRQKQTRDLTETLAELNQISVASTSMRRHAIDRSNIENLLRDGAISTSRYHTILETWILTDQDEQAFRSRQAQELFNAMLELLEDRNVNETHKVELIRFMTAHFSGDVRLVKPFISLYENLDRDYPRQKRLNQDFLNLYLQKREAILDGFKAISRPGLQPLLDYRRKTLPEISYSQTFLDRFLEREFQARIRPLYAVTDPLAIQIFLNREKYPPLQKFSGPAYNQDYLRRSLIRIAAENQAPEPGHPVMGLDQSGYDEIARALDNPAHDTLDRLVIHQNPAVRANLAWYLAGRKDPYTVPVIFELMQDPYPEVRRLAAIAIGNFRIRDIQNSNDRKFTEIVRMLVNYRTNADSFARAFAISGLASVGDRQKALYVIDLILNDGASVHSMLGDSAPDWKDDDEKSIVQTLIQTLEKTPEETYVKTHALKVLLGMESQESLAILMHYLHHIYITTDTRPGMLRYIIPHLTLPQEAENVEDMISFLAQRYSQKPEPLLQPLKTLRANLSSAYEAHNSAEFFQYLRFLELFDKTEFNNYVHLTSEHIMLMIAAEYLRSTYWMWFIAWPLLLLSIIILQYGFGLFTGMSDSRNGYRKVPNRHSNPAADIRNRRQTPAAAVLPIKINPKNP